MNVTSFIAGATLVRAYHPGLFAAIALTAILLHPGWTYPDHIEHNLEMVSSRTIPKEYLEASFLSL